MIDLTSLIGLEWDRGNERKSLDKHAVTQAEAEQVFFNHPLIIAADVKHSQSEPRFHALGTTHVGQPSPIRVISARDMHRTERGIYGKASS